MSDIIDDTAMTSYQDGQHIDLVDISRAEDEIMHQEEEEEFWHHISECKECRNTLFNWLKTKNNTTG